MSNSAVRSALFGRVQTLSAGTPVAWPGQLFEPPALWWDVSLAPNEPERLFIGNAGARQAGILLVGVMSQPTQSWASSEIVRMGFLQDDVYSSAGVKVRIVKSAFERQAFRDGAFWRIPVVVPFETVD